jgi:hypothetical protein
MDRRDLKTLPTAENIVAFFGNPIVAGILGVALGVALLAMTARGVKSFTPETLELGAMRAIAMMVLGLLMAFVGLLLFYLFVRPGLTAFGLGLAGGFVVPATVALFRMSGIAKTSN